MVLFSSRDTTAVRFKCMTQRVGLYLSIYVFVIKIALVQAVGADESGSLELGTKSDTAASSLLLEADREDQIPVTPPVTPQVIDDVTSSPTRNTRLQGAKRSYVEVAGSSLD
eukprot:scaffold1366_cov91-Cylindrotheca_fusiformis.AAC.8